MNTDSFVFGEPESFFSYIVESNEKGIVVKQICEYSEEEAETMMTVGDFENGCLCCTKKGGHLSLYALAMAEPFDFLGYLPESEAKAEALNEYASFRTDRGREFRAYKIPEYNERMKDYYTKGAVITCVDRDDREYLFVKMLPYATDMNCALEFTLSGQKCETADVFPTAENS